MTRETGKRARRRAKFGTQTVVSPTPETAAKLQQDNVERLRDEGRLTPEQADAALEIRHIWEAFGRGLFPRSGGLDRSRQARAGRFADPIQHMTAAEERVWRLRYRPWAREVSIEIVAGTVRVSRLQLVLDIIVDNYSGRQVEGWYRLRHGQGLAHVRAALQRYCEIAGWVSPKPYRCREI